MAGWGGFSQEDLNKLKHDHFKPEVVEELDHGADFAHEKPENMRKANINPGTRRQKPREKIKSRTYAPKKDSKSKRNENISTKETSEIEETKITNIENVVKDAEVTENEVECEKEKVPELIVETERIQEIEFSALQKMQQKQKEIEDQNKKKKAALQETIRTRYKKTQAEANTLKYVHKELAHLDNLLSADVAVLRDTIEEATRDYHHALKRYDHAEAEFVAAKLNLHHKTERKEMLTEHLLAIIQQNEERKAKKLEELMAKLEVSENVLEESMNKIDHNSNTGNANDNGNQMGQEGKNEKEQNIEQTQVAVNEPEKVVESLKVINEEAKQSAEAENPPLTDTG